MRVRAAALREWQRTGRIQRWVLFGSPGAVRGALVAAAPRRGSPEEALLAGLTFYDREGLARLDIDLFESSGNRVPIVSLGNSSERPPLFLGVDCGGYLPTFWLENASGRVLLRASFREGHLFWESGTAALNSSRDAPRTAGFVRTAVRLALDPGPLPASLPLVSATSKRSVFFHAAEPAEAAQEGGDRKRG